MSSNEKARIQLPERAIELPIIAGTENEKAIDIRSLRAESGYITLDVGYMNTGSCLSSITYIDGEKGILRYRGIPIEVLAEKSNFIETSYLLIYGDLPTKTQLENFKYELTIHTMLHEDIKRFFDGFPKSAHPMAILSSVVCSLSTFYQDEMGAPDEIMQRSIIRLLAKLPTIAAYSYKKSIGQPFVYPNNRLSYCENFLNMMFSLPVENYGVNPVVAKALDQLLILHADHEQNCSTSTVRIVGSSKANLYACMSAGICALWGPLHGGANQKVIEMLEMIEEDGSNVSKYVEMAKKKDTGFRLFGFGHRVYKNYDPRAKIIKRTCDDVLRQLNVKDPLLDVAMKLEDVALKDPYFIEKKLYPNVDFYSGIIYRAMGIPVPAFTVMFALGRAPGWIAHWKEQVSDPDMKIGRPRQVYTGPALRDYAPIAKRV